MATNNALNVGLSGSTGTGNFVGVTSPTFVTPTIGAATATSLAFSPTTGGLIGTTVADNASAGNVGEVISSIITSGSATSLSNITATSLTHVVLTAGDWDVWGNLTFIFTGANGLVAAGLNTVNNTLPDGSLYADIDGTFASATTQGIVAPYQRFNVNTNTNVYIVGYASFASGACTFCGNIFARRRR